MYICTGEAAKEVNLPIPLKVTTKLSITSIKEARFTMQFIKFEKTKRRSGVFQRQTPFKPTKLVMDINFYEELEKSLIEYSRQRARSAGPSTLCSEPSGGARLPSPGG